VKHKFLLDIMILYHGIKGVDERGNPASTSTDLLRLIRLNCHTIVVDRTLADKYRSHVDELFRQPSHLTEASLFITEFLANSAKMKREESDPPPLPPGANVPPEDEYVVRAALISHPLVVTAEGKLKNAVNNCTGLGLKAVTPAEALELARDS
jgi:hypothetical protein